MIAFHHIHILQLEDITRLIDVGGREILQGKNDWSYALIPIEIPALPSGIYILKATLGDKVLVERLNVVD